MLRRVLFLIPALLFLTAGDISAQPPRNFYAWWDSPVARDLNLTDAQMRQIRQTVREYRLRLRDSRNTLDRAEIELEYVFNEETMDPKKAQEAIDRLASARADLTKSFTEMSLKLRMVLTAEQWRELQKRGPERRNRPGAGNPAVSKPAPPPL
ncbi:MAG: Spy/CpxP family protein refolding chaperone [Bryobacteraceae bacterium]|nr:Spy/CpxP family protein refolding chaperone [Bryobacteraceae bacterium]